MFVFLTSAHRNKSVCLRFSAPSSTVCLTHAIAGLRVALSGCSLSLQYPWSFPEHEWNPVVAHTVWKSHVAFGADHTFLEIHPSCQMCRLSFLSGVLSCGGNYTIHSLTTYPLRNIWLVSFGGAVVRNKSCINMFIQAFKINFHFSGPILGRNVAFLLSRGCGWG